MEGKHKASKTKRNLLMNPSVLFPVDELPVTMLEVRLGKASAACSSVLAFDKWLAHYELNR
jgi:hypothetical protein